MLKCKTHFGERFSSFLPPRRASPGGGYRRDSRCLGSAQRLFHPYHPASDSVIKVPVACEHIRLLQCRVDFMDHDVVLSAENQCVGQAFKSRLRTQRHCYHWLPAFQILFHCLVVKKASLCWKAHKTHCLSRPTK